MIQRPVPRAETGCGRYGAMHEVESGGNGVLQRATERQASGDGSGEGAAGPVSGCRLDARMVEAANSPGCGQDIGDFCGGEMASFDQDGSGTETQQRRGRTLQSRHVMNHAAGQDRRFVYIGGYQGGQRKQVVADDLFGLGCQQTCTRGGYHDRIDHQRRPAVLPDGARHPPDHAGLGKHAGLERVGRQVFRQRGELGTDHGIGDGLDRAYSKCILRGEGNDYRGTEYTELLEGFQVGLNAGPAAGVGPGDCKRDSHRASTSMSSSLQTLIRDLHRRRGRERRGLTLAEGVRLVEEALATGTDVRGAAISPVLETTTRGKALKAALLDRGVRVEEVTEPELEELTETEHPQGIAAVVEPRTWTLADIRLFPGATTLVLDGVQDPGNVGTMLRTALGFGAAGVVALKGTADLTNPKVVRGGMGATFRLPAVPAAPEELVAWARLQRAEIWSAAVGGETLSGLPPRSAQRPPILLVVGNEGAGVGPIMAAAANRRIGISLAPGVESLNVAVAAGILLYEVTRD